MAEPFIGEIRMFGGNFAPQGWWLCNGQLLPISGHTALFSILGTTYGGNGQTNFALPNLQGRFAMHWGSGAGLSPRTIGETSGEETVTLINTQMAAHNHALQPNAASGPGNSTTPKGNVWAGSSTRDTLYGSAKDTSMATQVTDITGGSQPHYNMPPYQCVTFIIAENGIFPSRP